MIGDTVGGLLTDAIYKHTGHLNIARRNAIIIGFVGSLFVMSFVFITHDETSIILCLSASLFFLEMTEGPVWAVPMDIAPRYAGIAGGFISTAAGLAAVLSPLAFGAITDITGSHELPFALSIALLIVGVVLSFYIRADKSIEEVKAEWQEQLATQLQF
jgi:nitrate/nitrite transporter NarK